jgi:hypothetical protein
VQLWWPAFDDDHVVYDEHTSADDLPCWDPDVAGYVDPTSGVVLTTWQEALDAIDEDPEAEPAAVLRFGPQVDIKGIIAPLGRRHPHGAVPDQVPDQEHRRDVQQR